MDKNEIRTFIARRAAQELHDGDVVEITDLGAWRVRVRQ